MPCPSNPPSGCRFHTRCWLRERLGNPEQCTTDDPPLRELGPGHQVACHFAEQVDGSIRADPGDGQADREAHRPGEHGRDADAGRCPDARSSPRHPPTPPVPPTAPMGADSNARAGYARAMQPSLTIALAQIAPRLGDLDANLDRHHALIAEAREGGADLVVFPELGLTGYQLQDLASEVSMRLDDPRLAALAAETRGLSAVVSFVEESADHRLFIAAALLEDGEIRHVHRKVYLPTYGLFDERRFFAAGDVLRAVPSRLEVGIGIGDLRGLLAPRRAGDRWPSMAPRS